MFVFAQIPRADGADATLRLLGLNVPAQLFIIFNVRVTLCGSDSSFSDRSTVPCERCCRRMEGLDLVAPESSCEGHSRFVYGGQHT